MRQPVNKTGRIEVICGCMFSGKTEELIRRIRRAQIAKLSVIVFKPIIDSRYSESQIVSHNNIKIESHSLKSSIHINNYSSEFDVVGIDEAQFFDEKILNVCKKLANDGKRVIVAGLDKDYKGLPFGSMPELMCESDYLDKLRAICVICGQSASYTKRISKETDQVVIGELDKYEARCRMCSIDT
jgi:thymidine kinase